MIGYAIEDQNSGKFLDCGEKIKESIRWTEHIDEAIIFDKEHMAKECIEMLNLDLDLKIYGIKMEDLFEMEEVL